MFEFEDNLLVPIEVDALFFDAQSGSRLERWRHQYENLKHFQSSEPVVLGGVADDPVPGVYLLWTLPAALRRKAPGGGFPLIPNRWLVTRTSNRLGPERWLIESDYIHDDGDGNLVLVEGRMTPRRLGLVRSREGWVESKREAFLTAFDPNGAQGLFFQPQAENILSLVDRDISFPWDTRTYTVCGWHSSRKDDPLYQALSGSGPQADVLARFLERQSWTLSQLPDTSPTRCLYMGSICSVKLERPPDPDPAAVRVAVGPYPAETLRTLLVPPAGSHDADQAAAAALHGHLHGAGEAENAHDLVEDMHASQFGGLPGGTFWEIQVKPEVGSPVGIDPASSKKKPRIVLSGEVHAALEELNRAQAELDLEHRILNSWQRDGHETWWKKEAWKDGLAEAGWPTLKSRIHDVLARLPALEKTLQEKKDATRRVVAAQSSRDRVDYELEARQRPRFHYTLDPCVILEGFKTPPSFASDTRLLKCVIRGHGHIQRSPILRDIFSGPSQEERDFKTAQYFHDQLVKAVKKTFFKNSRSFPGQIDSALNVFGRDWTPPWLPLFLEWRVEWTFPRDGGLGGERFDGFDYPAEERVPMVDHAVWVDGRALLTEAISKPACDLLDQDAAVPEELKHLGTRNLLAAALRGMHTQLSGRDAKPNRTTDELDEARLFGKWHPVPQRGVQFFDGCRRGYFQFRTLQVVDRFGQVCPLIRSDAERLRTLLCSRMWDEPGESGTGLWNRFSLPQRLLQAARLDFEWETRASANGRRAIAGWLLPNHLDRTICVCTGDGALIRMLRQPRAGVRPVHEDIELSSTVTSAGSVELQAFVDFLSDAGSFSSVYDCLLRSYLEISPSESPAAESPGAALLGRPIALIRAKLAISLAESALKRPEAHFSEEGPLSGRVFPIVLGNARDTGDGLLGFWDDKNRKFQDTLEGSPLRLELKCISPEEKSSGIVTTPWLLVEPGAVVHAYTGILPVKDLRLPADEVEDSLASLTVPMRVGPILTSDPFSAAQDWGETPKVTVPHPDSSAGNWRWKEMRSSVGESALHWAESDLAVPSETTDVPRGQTLRDGFLVFTAKPGRE